MRRDFFLCEVWFGLDQGKYFEFNVSMVLVGIHGCILSWVVCALSKLSEIVEMFVSC
jgi:hypothetical protein